MGDLQFYLLLNSIPVISRRWEGDSKRMCATTTFMVGPANLVITDLTGVNDVFKYFGWFGITLSMSYFRPCFSIGTFVLQRLYSID